MRSYDYVEVAFSDHSVLDHLIELQGGRIWVRSKEGQGSCFSFTLPIIKEAEVLEEEYLPAAFGNEVEI